MKKTLFFVLVLFSVGQSFAQSIWKKVSQDEVNVPVLARDSHPSEFQLYFLNIDVLKAKLATAPSRTSGVESSVVVAFPNPQGQMQNFRIYEASVMHPELAARHSEIQSYVGLGIDDKTATIRFSTTLFGLHTMTFSGVNGTSYIDPYSKDLKYYMVFNKSSLQSTKSHVCKVTDEEIDIAQDLPMDASMSRASNGLFKTYRLALACTIEYAAFHVNAAGLSGGTLAQKKAAVLAAMVVTMTRVNFCFERDMAFTLVLIPNNEDIINITSDSLDNNNTNNVLLGQNQTFIDGIIGDANYDIGHIATTGGGGVATPQSPCNSGSKARGVTGLDSPVGDQYDIDFVAHEMGHQYGCSHTFNGDGGNCGGGNRVQASAFEPGSGTTIMAYAGICAPQDVQQHSDAYYHARSLIQMISFVNGAGNCGVITPNGNSAPVVDAGLNYTIPNGTPFVLTGAATDADNDSLTYCWEQYNAGSTTGNPSPTITTAPNFRSFNPTASTKRYFPSLETLTSATGTSTWEVLPTVARTMVFSLVVRDNRSPLGGQTQRGTMNITFASVGPFKVTSQAATEAWAQNSSQTVTWDVAGTDGNGINVSQVNIKLSTDGGLTYPYTLATNTANDGSEVITAPDLVATNCRVMVESVGNVFFAINSKPFYVGYEMVTDCNTYNYSGAAFNLNDGATSYTVRSINVPTAGTVSDVNITVNATHPNIQNLVMAVIRPGNSTINVFYNQQCAGSANMNVTFDQQGSAFTCGSPTTGTYAPPTTFSLNNFNGVSQQGNWQFGFRDAVTGNVGSIDSFSLEVCSSSFVLLANSAFEFENFSLAPNPNDSNFNIRFNSNSTGKVGIVVHDLSGRKIFDKSYDNTGMFDQQISLDNAQAGIYLVSITDGDKKMTKRIVVK
ncbi:T9SS type A sorting domain-containing protein [Flavobacterium sp. CYK-4]|uniref:reprolysin-like metallopeptidase n=1 Tax=Flavobacterium lotistagni TaxID=2709660 RepID=UPI00140E6D44|nr:zinc-dependent metalloprotease family protein [Flavobacterium lotistagni]NHM06604.1 T9SS type A sorting domain-containing protein [Flavobacterium lotistagni]